MRLLWLLSIPLLAPFIYASPCGLYLAPSSVPKAGFGVFTTREYEIGERIGYPSVAIPYIDAEPSDADLNSLLNQFLHSADGIGGFGEATNVSLFLPGLPSLVQFHTSLDNVVVAGLTLDSSMYRSQSPMAGSFTAYHNVTLVAKARIAKGQELFLYPTNLLLQRSLPQREAYNEAENLVQEISKYAATAKVITSAQWTDLLFRMRNDVVKNTKVADLLPLSEYELYMAAKHGLARSKLIPRTNNWIEEQGACLDAIQQDSSRDGIGRGGFSTRFLQKGSVVMTTPVIPVHQNSFGIKNNAHNNSQQLLLNYCLGHRRSTTLFCPTTSAALMNHDGVSPNVKLRWKEPATLLHGSLEDYWNASTSRNNMLTLEYIAIRDIQEGEELLLGYGEEWEEAYETHLNQGVSDATILPELSAEVYNNVANDFWILSEHVPSHLRAECMIHPQLSILEDKGQWEDFSSNPMVHKENWPSGQRLIYAQDDMAGWNPCEVVSKQLDGKMFDVRVFPQDLAAKGMTRRFRGVPRDRIRFVNVPYHSDQHLPWAFRHYISIPDEIFPLRWRDDYKAADHWKLGLVEERNLQSSDEIQRLQEEYETTLRQAKCGVYMATSNIPNAGFGTYAAVDIPAQNILVGSSIPEVPLNKQRDPSWPGTEYVWQSHGLPENLECPEVLRGLFGAIANSHTGITNMISPPRYDPVYDPIVDRRFDPGAGAFTPYFDNHFLSAYPVKAGEELFVTYGEHWFRNRAGYADVPLKEHFRSANDVVAAIWSMSTLEGASLFHADLVRKANQNKFNPKFHDQNEVLLSTCQFESSDDTMKTIVLRPKSARPNNMPSSVAARMDIPETFESYEGIGFDDGAFDIPLSHGPGGSLFYPCKMIAGYEAKGTMDVLIFVQKHGKRVLIKRSQMPQDLLEFRVMPAFDNLKGLVDLFRDHAMKEFDDSGSVISDWYRRTRTALTGIESFDDIRVIMERNGTAMATTKPRSNEWLEQNGYCMDHIYSSRSSIPKAGNGAFSRRFLPKGSTVIGSPLLAGFRDHFLFNMTLSSSGNVSPTHKSLIYNYHFGHKESTVLFFPISPIIAINHNSKSMPDGKEANARVEFSTKDKKSRYLLHRPLEDIRKERYSALVMEVVATRDIEPDEEIFIDYGHDWEESWKTHVAHWQDPCQDIDPTNKPCFKSSAIIAGMNRDKFNESYHAWSEDHLAYCTYDEGKVDPSNVHTVVLTQDNQFRNFESAVITEHYESYHGISSKHKGFQIAPFLMSSGERVYPCQIVSASSETRTFEVILFHSSHQKAVDSVVKVVHVWNFTSDRLVFRPRPFHGDTTNPKAFRHEIGIPDESFPELWKDLKKRTL